MRTSLAYAILSASVALAQAPDLSEFRTVATAQKTTIKDLSGPPKLSGHLGVNVDSGSTDGLKVIGVEADSPAAKAGLQLGDKLLALNGAKLAGIEQLREKILSFVDGDTVKLQFQRGSQTMEAPITLGAPSRPMTLRQRVSLGITSVAQDDGVKINAVTPGLPGSKSGLKPGDILSRIGSAEVNSSERIRDVLNSFSPGQKVTLTVKREGKELNIDCVLAADSSPAPQEDRPTLARWDESRGRVFKGENYRLAVIPIAFSDVAFNEKITPQDWEKALFSTGEYKNQSATGQDVFGSMNDYYQEISCGKFKVSGKIFKPVTLNKKQSEYSSASVRNSVFTEALDKILAENGKDSLSQFDGLFFLQAGKRVQTQRGSVFWPHRSSLNYQGKRWAYFICPEGGAKMSSISVICHEFGHMLGLPDLYAKPENPGSEGVGIWCTMSNGHGRDGRPLHFSAWCKEQLGWIQPCVIDPNVKQKLILSPIEGSPNECFKILVRKDGSEYLLLENRKKQMYDRELPGEGLLIWRVVDNRPILEESHGVLGPDGPQRFLGSVPFPSRSNTSFTPYTQPSSKPQKNGGLPIHITNIERLPDGRITFHIGFEYI